MESSLKKKLRNIGVILLISVGCTFYFAGGNFEPLSILFNVLYGVIIGSTIALGSSLITRAIFKTDKVYENPTKYFVLSVLAVSSYIVVAISLVNLVWFYLTQGITVSEFFSRSVAYYILGTELFIGMMIYLIALARYFARDLQRYYSRVAEVESQLSKYRYDTLKNQLNPHFLFNALNTLSGLIYIDADRADAFTHRLSKLYRYILDVQQVEVVPIATEMGLVSDFLYLNNIRFNDQIVVENKLSDVEGYVVPMALQLLLENAIKHNTISEKSPLQIQLFSDEKFIHITNNIQRKIEKEPSHELGLNNLRERYAVLTDREIEIEQTLEHFTVRIPILHKSEA